MEKMSVSKPVMKRPRQVVKVPPTVIKKELEPKVIACQSQEEENPGRTGTLQEAGEMTTEASTSMTVTSRQAHPKWHKVKYCKDVWQNMDKQTYLRAVDTILLNDVWVQPTAVTIETANVVTVELRQVVYAYHIKRRDAKTKLFVDDLMKMLYLADSLRYDLNGNERVSYEDWLNEKLSEFLEKEGTTSFDGNNSKVAKFILEEDHNFTLYPCVGGKMGIFFRKIYVHSYKESGSELKMNNPSVVKCHTMKGDGEYILEARILALPSEWFDHPMGIDTEELPASQPI